MTTLLPPLKNRRIILLAITLFILVPVLTMTYTMRRAAGTGTTSSIFNFKGGVSLRKVADELGNRKVITSPKLFTIYARLKGDDARIKAGFYQLNDGMSPREILRKLVAGEVYSRPFVLPEGYSIYQAAELLDQQGLLNKDRFLARCLDPALLNSLGITAQSAEGYLAPGTYNIEPDMDEASMVKAMAQQFDKVRKPRYDAQVKAAGKTWHEVLTLASLIEKEAVVPAERPVIASVFANRTVKKMRLQSDPTAVYGVRAFAGAVTRSDILRPSPYNTYLIDGLPPGPIGNPGDAAIEAVLTPARTNYLYFVARQDGSHQFSATLDEHNRAVQKYLR